MATPDDKRRAREKKAAERRDIAARKADERAAERAAGRAARKVNRAAKRKAKQIAKRATKSYRQVGGNKAYCTTCHKWYNPRNRRQNRKHDHLG